MAEFSYALEKYFDVTSILPTLFVIAALYAMIFTVLLLCIENLYLKKHRSDKKALWFRTIYPIVSLGVSAIVNILILSPQMWNSKIHRVMSNFQYVLSFSSNRQIFFDALGIPDTAVNQTNVFDIALKLNDTQWLDVSEAAGSAAWYFVKIEKAIRQILKVDDYHLSINVVDQGWYAYIPCILLIILGTIIFAHAHKLEGCTVLLAAAVSVILSLGGAIFLCTMIYFGYGTWFVLSKAAERQRKKRQGET